MKYLFFCFLFLIACGDNTTTMKEDRAAEAVSRETSVVLADLPSKYKGYIGCPSCDSLELQISLSTDLQYVLNLKFIGEGKSNLDSVNNGIGEWTLNDENVIELHSREGSAMYSKFKILSKDELQLLDSTGSVITNGKNYILKKISDNEADNS